MSIWVGDAIQPSHPLSSPFPSAPNPSQHQSFLMSQLFTWGGQSTGVSALASFLRKNTQDWYPLEWTGRIPLKSKGLSRIFSAISKLKWMGIGEFNSDGHYIHYSGQESLRRNGVAFIVTRVWSTVFGCNPQNNRMIPICFQGKPFNITVI